MKEVSKNPIIGFQIYQCSLDSEIFELPVRALDDPPPEAVICQRHTKLKHDAIGINFREIKVR